MRSGVWTLRCMERESQRARPGRQGATRIFGFIVSVIVISVTLGSLIMAEGKYIHPSVVDLLTMHLQQDAADQPPHAGY